MSHKKRRLSGLVGLAGILAAALVTGTPGSASAAPVITDLGALPNGSSFASGVNDSGVIVGGIGGGRAVRWDTDGSQTDLGTLPGDDYALARGINAGGSVVGISANTSNGISGMRAVRWDTDGTITALDPLPGDTSSDAMGINAGGVIIGISFSLQVSHAVVWAPDGTVTALAALPGDTETSVTAINSSGTMVGYSSSSGSFHAVRWQLDGSVTALPPLDDSHLKSTADGINDNGTIVGGALATVPGGDFTAVRWDPDGTVVDIGALAGNSYSAAVGINNSGVIIGVAYAHGHGAVRWELDGTITDLGALPGGTGGSTARAINSTGTVVGDSSAPDGYYHAVRWD